MTRISALFITVLLLSATSGFAQSNLSPDGRALLQALRQSPEYARDNAEIPGELVKRYDLTKRDGIYYIDAAVMIDPDEFSRADVLALGAEIRPSAGNLITLRLPVQSSDLLAEIKGVKYIEIGGGISPDLEFSVPDVRADSVHKGSGGLTGSYTGKGVIIAVIDWGFDYTHPVFYDSTLTHLRLSRAWDQNKLSGPPPEGYGFGTEYVGEDELLSSGRDTNYVFGYMSHGTHVAGIAGGSGGGTVHKGIAPDAELVFISLRRDAPSLISAFTYIRDYAASAGKPYVVNMSFGSHLGPHDGSSLENTAISNIAGSGRIFAGSAGNNGSAAFHLRHDFTQNSDTLRTVVNFNNNIEDSFGQTVSMWGSPNSSFAASLKFTDASNTTLFQTPFYFSGQSPISVDTFDIPATGDTVILRVTASGKSPLNDKPNIRFEIQKKNNLKCVLEVASTDTDLHIWNFVRMNNRYTNWGVLLGNNFPGAERGDIDFGLGEPGGVGKSVITVASHRGEWTVGGNPVGGQLSGYSSKGPTVDERQKPDISGPGQSVISSVNSYDPDPGAIADSVTFDGRTYYFAVYSGTSMSGPAVAGVIALMLEANPNLDHTQVKEIIHTTARLDQYTGDLKDDPDLRWGYGKVNALAAVLMAETLLSTDELSPADFSGSVYPNPAHDRLFVKNGAQFTEYSVYAINGTEMKTGKLNKYDNNTGQIDITDLKRGMYLITLTGNGERRIEKFAVK